VLKLTNAKPLEWGSASSPYIMGDQIFVQGGKEGDAIAVAINKNSGALTWKSEAKGLSGYATAIVIDVGPQKQLIVFAGEAVFAMNPDTGRTIWNEPWKTDYDINAATPIFHDGKLLLTSQRNFGSMLISVTPNGHKKEWEKKDIMSKFQPPILDDGVVYVNSNGSLKCVSFPEGALKWTATPRDANLGAGGSLVRVGDKLIALSERGKLSLIQASPSGYKLLSSFQLFDYSQVWSSPVIYRGKLYAKGETELVCLDISAPK
jgi:outer membrane protein assembly factor BamB